MLQPLCKMVFDCPFGSSQFLDLIEREKSWDCFCHHAAWVENYKSPDFDVIYALNNNTYNLNQVICSLKRFGCEKIILTGSVFEQGEGKGDDVALAASPYGLSKGLTSDFFRYYSFKNQMPLAKFVIPNPFGPYEELKYTGYLMSSWLKNIKAEVKTPLYVRDNIHVSLLSRAYAEFAGRKQDGLFVRFNPSGYVESQADFTLRFAREIRKRLKIPCEFDILPQTIFLEPIKRVNFDHLDYKFYNWNEDKAWDEIAEYYKGLNLA